MLSAPSSLSLSSILRARAAEKSVHGRIKWRDSIPGSELSDYSEHHEPQHRQQPQQHQPQQHQPQQQQQQESLPLLEFNQHADDRCLDRADCWFYNKNNKCFKAESCVYRHCFAARESSEQCQGFLMYRRCPDPMRCNRRHDLQPAALRAAAAPSHHVVEESLVELDLNNPDLLNESALETFEISKVVAQCGVSRAKAVRALNQSANKTAHGAFLVRARAACSCILILLFKPPRLIIDLFSISLVCYFDRFFGISKICILKITTCMRLIKIWAAGTAVNTMERRPAAFATETAPNGIVGGHSGPPSPAQALSASAGATTPSLASCDTGWSLLPAAPIFAAAEMHIVNISRQQCAALSQKMTITMTAVGKIRAAPQPALQQSRAQVPRVASTEIQKPLKPSCK